MSLSLLLLSDIAGSPPEIPLNVLESVDLILLAGDITIGAKSDRAIKRTIDKIAQYYPSDIPILLIPGNHDFPKLAEHLSFFPKNFVQMHNRSYKFQKNGQNLLIIGFGGARYGLFNNFAFHEEEIYYTLKLLFENTKKIREDPAYITLLLVHDPPLNTKLDMTYRNEHVGSNAVRKIIEEYHPHIAVAGHIHESRAVDHLKGTLCVNAGEGKKGNYALIKIKDFKNIDVELKHV